MHILHAMFPSMLTSSIDSWTNSTYRVGFIQDQPSSFVVSGNDFVIDAFNASGGIHDNDPF